MTTQDLDTGNQDDYDPFEEFNRSAGMGVVENPYPLFALVRSEHPIKREGADDAVLVPPGSDIDFMPIDRSVGVFTAFSFDAVQQVLKDGETFSSAGYAEVMGQVIGHSILEMDEPEHHLYRGLVQQAFSRKAMDTWEHDLVRGVVDEHIDEFIDRPGTARRSRARADLPVPRRRHRPNARPAARRPAHVPSPRGARSSAPASSSTARRAPRTSCTSTSARSSPSGAPHPSDDVISVLAQAELEGNAPRTTTRSARSCACSYRPAPRRHTARRATSCGVCSRNPDQLDALRNDRDLMPQAIEEGLRWEPPLLGIMRTATRDTEVDRACPYPRDRSLQ